LRVRVVSRVRDWNLTCEDQAEKAWVDGWY
jgi:hypothetical protein